MPGIKKTALEAIASLFQTQPQSQPVQNTDLAQYILTHSYGGPSKTVGTDLAAKQGAETEHPGLLSKVFDQITSGVYATENIVHDLGKAVHDAPQNNPSGNPLESVIQGMEAGAKSVGKNVTGAVARGAGNTMDILSQITGLNSAPVLGGLEQKAQKGLQDAADQLSPRRMGSTNLGEMGVKNKALKYGGGFAADVALDPITYVPGLDILSTIRKAKQAKLAAQGFRDTAETAIPKTSEQILEDRAATGATPGLIPAPAKPMPKINLQPPAEMAVGRNMIPPVVKSVGDIGIDPFSQKQALTKYSNYNERSPLVDMLVHRSTTEETQPLYRGAEDLGLEPGSTFALPESTNSLTHSPTEAFYYANGSEWKKAGTAPAIYKVVGGTKGLDYRSAVPMNPRDPATFSGTGEFLSRGQFKVIKKEIVTDPATKKPITQYTVAQIPTDEHAIAKSILGDPQQLDQMKALRRSDNATRAANVRWGKPVDWHDIPEMSREEKAAWADNMRQAKMAKKGVVSDGKGSLSISSANDVIENINDGIIPRFGPEPVGAEGEAAARAAQVAEKHASNLSKAARKGRPTNEMTPVDQSNLFNSVINESRKMVNENFAKRAPKELTDKQREAYNGIKAYVDEAQASGKQLTQADIENEVNILVGNKSLTKINKTDAKAILREFFPPEPIKNPAATRYGKREADLLAQQMLKTAEDHLIAKGVQPTWWNGMRVRLSDVLAEVGSENSSKYHAEIMDAFMNKNTSKLTNPAVAEAVNKALARRSLATSDMLAGLSQKTQQLKNDILAKYKYPTPMARRELDALPSQAAEVAKSLGATSVEAKSMSNYVQTIIDSQRLPEERLMDELGADTAKALLEGTATREVMQKSSRLIYKMIEETPAQAAKDATGNKAAAGFLARFSMYYGRPEIIKQFQSKAYDYAEVNAADKAKFFRQQAKDFTREELDRGFNLARQPEELRLISEGLESDPKVLQTAAMFKDYFDMMLGSTGFNKIEDLSGVTAVRSSMVMTDVQKHLKALGSKFTFSDRPKGSFKHATGEIPRNYSRRGVGWMQSWENADPAKFGQDPLSFMYDMDLAIQRTSAEYATLDEFGRKFGATVDDAHYNSEIHKAIIPNPRLAGLRFHPEIQQQMLRLIDDMEKGQWKPSSPMMRQIVRATRVWKSSVTIYRPIHHEKNLVGDAFNMWLAGHNNPLAFNKAAKVLRTQRARYHGVFKEDDIEGLKNMISSDALNLMSKPNAEAKVTDVIIDKRGTKLTSENLWSSGYKRGLFKSYNIIEDILGQTPAGTVYGKERTLFAPFKGGVHERAAKVSEYREHFVRMAHYIAAVEKGVGRHKGTLSDSALNKIYDRAADEVSKYHPDGSNLTQFEQRLRIVIPFYAWTRKEIPLLAQAMVERPAKIVAMPRAERALAGASGINVNEDQGMLDPYPNDQLFPDWIRSTGIGPIGDPESNNPVARFWASFGATQAGLNGPKGYVTINPSNPFNDVATQLFGFGSPKDIIRSNVNSLNPGLQIPMQLWANQTFSGAPIYGPGGHGVTDYLLRQIPQIGETSRLSGLGRNDKPDVQGKTKQNLINFLTSAGILGTGPYIKSAEFEAKARAKNASSN